MIASFSVYNFLSFRSEQTLSFEAFPNKDFEDLNCVEVKEGVRLLKLGVLYGSNASGKTNVLKALNFVRRFVQSSRSNKTESTGFIPFLFDDELAKQPGGFSLTFYLGKTKYIYQLKLDDTVVFYERLVYYPSTQPALVFERAYDKKLDKSIIEFGGTAGLNSNERKLIEGFTIKNSSVIASYGKANIKRTVINDVYDWFSKEFLRIVTPRTDLFAYTCTNVEKEEKCKELILEFLQKADFNISDILFKENKLKIEEINEWGAQIPESDKQKIVKEGHLKVREVLFKHKTDLSEKTMPIKYQSSGTLRYYEMGGLLARLLHPGTFMMIDELENSLHTDLVTHFLKTFLANTERSQLLVTTHDIHLLGEDFLRRDSIWFTEKNQDGASELFSLLDFKLHKNLSPFNAYRVGKLGAKPQPGSIFLNNE